MVVFCFRSLVVAMVECLVNVFVDFLLMVITMCVGVVVSVLMLGW